MLKPHNVSSFEFRITTVIKTFILYYRNQNCINLGPVAPPAIPPAKPCHKLCQPNVYRSKCQQPSGRCLCFYGWTGPNANYNTGDGIEKTKILADYCQTPCHYTHDYSNPACVTNAIP